MMLFCLFESFGHYYSRFIASPILRQEFSERFYPKPHESGSFPVWLKEQALSPALCGFQALFPLMFWVFPSLRWLPYTQGLGIEGTLCRSPGHPHATLCSLVLYSANQLILGSVDHSSISPTQRVQEVLSTFFLPWLLPTTCFVEFFRNHPEMEALNSKVGRKLQG